MKSIYKKILNKKTVIIAEAGVNHNGDINIGKKLIEAAKRSGADCIKFQTYKAKELTTKNAKRFWSWSGEEKKNGSQFDSYSKLDSFSIKEYSLLNNYCKKLKIEFQSTPFDISSLKLLEKINVNTYKIASCDITNFPLIQAIAKTKKPIFLSTGASEIKEIKEAINVIKKNQNNKIVIMHCILCYPTKPEDTNLKSITLLKKIFKNYPIGFSDHTLGTNITKAAIALGAVAVEKHFTINKKLLCSADHWLSIDEPELTDLVRSKNNICDAMGYEIKKPFFCELIAKKNARRSIVANKYISAGEKYSGDNITTKRPGTGISANLYFKYLGKKSNKNYKPDDLIKK